MPPIPSHPHLRALLTDAEAVRREAERLRASLSDAQLTWRPDDKTWSVADVFEHLRKINKAYGRRLGEALGRTRPGDGPFRPGPLTRLYVWAISPEGRLPIPAPPRSRPMSTPPGGGDAALARFLEQQDVLEEQIRAADGRDLNTGRFPSPILPVFMLSVGAGLTGLVRHEQRHLGQALRLTRRPDFPSP
jgi:hypothetical protein